MKILLVNDFKETIGGTEVYVYEIKSELERRGHVVEVFSSNLKKNRFNPNKTITRLLSLLFNFYFFFQFRKKSTSFKPDIVHVNSIFNVLSPSFLLNLREIPVVMTVHDNQLFSPVSLQTERTGKACKTVICRGCTNCVGITGYLYEIIRRKIQKPLLDNIDIYIGNSSYINSAIRQLQFGRIKDIPFCVQSYKAYPISNFNTILYVGRLTKEKGVQYAIQAIPSILRIHPKVKMLIVGIGPYKSRLQNQVQKMKLAPYVKFLGFKTHQQLQRIYRKSTISILPAIWDEPFGKTGIESMSAGRPLIATRVGGIPEWLEDGKSGYLVKPKDKSAISEKAILLLSNRQNLESLAKYGKKKSNEFSVTNHVDNLEKIYKNLVVQYKH